MAVCSESRSSARSNASRDRDVKPDAHAELFHTAFEEAAVGMTILRPDGTALRVNRAACEILGYEARELVGRSLRSLTHPDDLAANSELAERAVSGEIDHYVMDKRYIRKDGRVVWVTLSVSLLRHDDGTPRYFLSQIRDITERKQDEAEFAATHLRLRQVLERIADGFYALDRDWRFTYVNAAAERMLGQPRSALIGANVWEAFPHAVETTLFPTYHQALEDGQTATIELYYLPLSTWFEVRVYPSPDGLSVFFRDITVQRQAMQEVQASEARFRTLVEQLPVAVYLHDADTLQTLRYLSPRYEQVTGYLREEALARKESWLSLVHPEDRDRVAAESEHSLRTETTFACDYRFVRKDGEIRWMYDQCNPIRDASGTVIAWIGTLLDITDRVEAEAMQARLAAIVEAAVDGIMSVARDGTILSWNRGAERLYGYTAEEAIGQDVVMLRPPEAENDIAESVALVWQGETVAEQETVRLTRDGRRISVSLSLFPIRDAQGRIVAVSSISHDLTSLRQTEAALRVRDRALEATRNSIVITDPRLPDNPIVDVNPAFTTLTGYSRADVIGLNCRFLQGPDTDAAAVRRIRDAIEAGEDVVETLLNYRSDGTPFWNDLSLAAVRDANGVVTNFVGVQSDATERKRYEQELELALEAAQGGMRAKSQFLAMMSHELRTPLQSVMGYAHLLLLDNPDALSDEQREDIAAIQQGASRMSQLIEQLLDLTRMDAGILVAARDTVDLTTIMDQVRQDVAPLITTKGLTFDVEFASEIPPFQGDPTWLRQILLNLVGNAVKFTEDGSVTVHTSITNDELIVRVRDTGIGIAPEDLPFIFDEFHQVDGSMTRHYEGAGLGLAISKRLAEHMSGVILVASTPGVGSEFTLRLPLLRHPAA